MVSVTDGRLIYLTNKTDEYIQNYGNENINKYIGFYEDKPLPLKQFFSLFHFQFNSLLKYMNSRISYGHYTADESRELIYLIDELETVQSNLKDSEFTFDFVPYYKERLQECSRFLRGSGGSPIPSDFQKINIIEVEPIFHMQSTISIKRSAKKALFPTKLIGRGSYATVHKYKDEYYNKFFVIKKALKNLTKKEYERFRIEFEEMKRLNSPYVIEVYNFDEENHQYIMEYADETLDSHISKYNGSLNLNDRIGLIRQIFQAFIYINSKDILHRDISTKNILLKKYDGLNIIKISDFGLVKRQDSALTNKNTEMKGSLNDPKLEIVGFNNYEIRHETYALTRIVYFIMTGKKKLETFRNKEFEKFINKGISDNINERYKNVAELHNSFFAMVNSLK
ncbi:MULTISPECIES: protein kinase domain-containing protein [Bacillus cereus group]|uniref:Protein kinase n=1 Tax=Bacillus cereus TaxID=1396 RepID=A0A9W7QHQ6_BACCE|nr:protein kinase [Bacillus cereus]KAB2397465.1 protein kinase [Bacillus cereus]KAB2402688.1 protein kinase [Bacillus cereus]KAB2431658.1 protein kinase [Bacillus cereus]